MKSGGLRMCKFMAYMESMLHVSPSTMLEVDQGDLVDGNR